MQSFRHLNGLKEIRAGFKLGRNLGSAQNLHGRINGFARDIISGQSFAKAGCAIFQSTTDKNIVGIGSGVRGMLDDAL